MTSTFDFCCDLIRSVKHNSIVIVGGVHATIAYKDCLDQDCIDYAFVGEADRGILDFVEALEKKEDVTTIQGLAYKNKDGEYINNLVGPRVCLDNLPCPDWAYLMNDIYLDLLKEKSTKEVFILNQEDVQCNVNIVLTLQSHV